MLTSDILVRVCDESVGGDQVAALVYDGRLCDAGSTMRMHLSGVLDRPEVANATAGCEVSARLGQLETGVMFARSVTASPGGVEIDAAAIPPTGLYPVARAWTKVRIADLVQDLAGMCELSIDGLDKLPSMVCPHFGLDHRQTPGRALAALCRVEGLLLRVHDRRADLLTFDELAVAEPAFQAGHDGDASGWSWNPLPSAVTVTWRGEQVVAQIDIEGRTVALQPPFDPPSSGVAMRWADAEMDRLRSCEYSGRVVGVLDLRVWPGVTIELAGQGRVVVTRALHNVGAGQSVWTWQRRASGS